MTSNWSSTPNSSSPANAFANLSLKPSPLSSRSGSPGTQSTTPSGAKQPSANSFANIAPFGKKPTNNLSLLEQQQLREARRRKDEEERQKQMDQLFGGGSGGGSVGFWEGLEGKSKPLPSAQADEDDILAGFSAAAPVDNSSYYPPPQVEKPPSAAAQQKADPLGDFFGGISNKPSGSVAFGAMAPASSSGSQPFDPFDFDSLSSKSHTPVPPSQSAPRTQVDDEFDILGDLSKPVSEIPPRPEPSRSPNTTSQSPRKPEPSLRCDDPRDLAIAEIVDMGFSVEQSREALAQTETGLDVQGAIGYILDQAHHKSKSQRSTPQDRAENSSHRNGHNREPPSRHSEIDDTPAWARNGGTQSGSSAAAIGGSLFKSANSLWNAGRKKVEKAVAEFQADLRDDGGDPNMPRWMRERQIREQLEARGAKGITHNDRPPKDPRPESGKDASITDEALMLEMGSGPPQHRKKARDSPAPSGVPSSSRSAPPSGLSQRDQIQLERQRAFEDAIREKERELQERQQRARNTSAIPDSASRRAKLEAESETVYVSRNRRRPPPASSSSKSSTPALAEGDLLSSSKTPAPRSNNPFAEEASREKSRSPQPPRPATQQRAFPTPTRRTAPRPPRKVPQIPPSSLTTSNTARRKGTEAFKLGDYALAQQHYSNSISPIPATHPLRIILLTNRSLSHIKLGDPRSALSDITEILNLIGPLKGVDETITLDGSEKPMPDYWSKAIIRKAECLEQLEKWVDAKTAWEEALSAGVGGAQANAGKRRCENAINPPKPQTRPASSSPPSSASSNRRRPPPPRSAPPTKQASDREAVRALRAQNAATEKAEAEKFALHDSVEEKINAWKNGKEGNLRALLAGLDTVLWEGAGWKKVGMGDLLMPNKCKIWYMKGIAKVHPDKIPQNATTEQRMISAAVFSLLNEAWDAFKAENGL
ncbi:hypothetical protein EX30DRAFT_316971 [Ascodesmis nigricans]|uniref:UBA domain-containing protein n=1 Tax=Ascodesmis nigricans TaxID=341454 RepID=A0A4S2N219_9PEZI|nr:hypothetical protein EX30DRAFT_316971 [Ascodesmis nigricans]